MHSGDATAWLLPRGDAQLTPFRIGKSQKLSEPPRGVLSGLCQDHCDERFGLIGRHPWRQMPDEAPHLAAGVGAIVGDMVEQDHKIFAAGVIVRQHGAITEAQIAFQLGNPQYGDDGSAVPAAFFVELNPAVVTILDRRSRLRNGDEIVGINAYDSASQKLADFRGDEVEPLSKVSEVDTTVVKNCQRLRVGLHAGAVRTQLAVRALAARLW
jgi:hypothetical protein